MRVLCLIFLFLLSCKTESEYTPPLLEDQIIEMLVDMHTAEGALSRLPVGKIDSARIIYLDQIYKKYQLNDSTHLQLMEHLKKEPERLSEIYRIVFDSIEARGARLEPNI